MSHQLVLNMAYGEHTLAVDTHVFRVANALGLRLEKRRSTWNSVSKR
jgi:endonuclease III